jgi:C4-type Zn-finger protein
MNEEFVAKCPKCGIPMKRSGKEPAKGEFGTVKLTCEKCGKKMLDIMIPTEAFFGPEEAQ